MTAPNRKIRWGAPGCARIALDIPDTFFDDAGALTPTVGEERREIQVEASDRYRLEVEDFANAIFGLPTG